MRYLTFRVVPGMIAGLMAVCAHAQTPASPSEDTYRVTLDIDHDGKPDRAELLRNPRTNAFDLRIEPGASNDRTPVPPRQAVAKSSIAAGLVLNFAARGKDSLVITTGCGGCSNDTSTTLTIVHRRGQFMVAGYTLEWDTRSGSGTCDVNFLTGKGALSRDGGKARPLKERFAPIRLEDWSDEKRPQECE